MAPGARSWFGTAMLEFEVFRKHIYCIEESTCDIVGNFCAPVVIWRPGNCPPLDPLVTPLCMTALFITTNLELNPDLKAFKLIEMRFLLNFFGSCFQFQLISLTSRIKVQRNV